MAIVKMNKFTLLAFQSQKETILESLQKFQGVQFVSFEEKVIEEMPFLEEASDNIKVSEVQSELAKVKFLLDFMDRYVPREKGIKAIKKGKKHLRYDEIKKLTDKSNWISTYETLKKFDNKLNDLKNEISKLKGEIEELTPWTNLDVSFADLKSLKTSNYFIGTANKNLADKFVEEFNSEVSSSYTEKLGETRDEVSLLVLFHKSQGELTEDLVKKYNLNKFDFRYDNTPKGIIKEYNSKIEAAENEAKGIEQEIKKYSDKIEDLEIAFEYYSMEENKAKSGEYFLKTDKVLVIEGWTPEEKKAEFEDVLKSCCGDHYFIEFREPSSEDNVPILLKNNKFVEPYEIITSMYSLPNYREVDPTPAMTPFFFVFFGMMLSDAGYGLVMLIASTLALKLLPLDKGVQKFMKLFQSISISTIAWGIVYGSYFGDATTMIIPGGIKPLWLDPSSEPMSVLILAIIMGFVHLYTGLGIKAYELIKSGKALDALFDVGFWYLTISGLVLLFIGPSMGIPVLGTIGKYMAIVGLVGLVATQGRSNKGIVGKIAGGFYGIYGITGYLGDILSYSRLLALGLATGLIGTSFNLMVSLLGNGVFAWIFGTVIFLGGHIFNLAINVLGAYVHACRLQYLEFFGKFYSGGGKEFKPFTTKNKYIRIIKD
ncbi:V-type ATP synthase subunit I [Clostridium sp. HMP27]|nr:V-type ATP synthase subunit I [Clostridium sp. HMP27]KGK87528.1 ATP synthase subunit I [Clostridium sp. HMP27]